MPIPNFTEHGLLPAGVHECTFAEAGAFLCLNERRNDIWSGLQNFLVWASEFPAPDAFLIDGSYVTDKPLPGDVDVVVDITGCSQVDQAVWVTAWAQHHAYAKDAFLVDFYPFAIGEGSDFSAYFQYVRVEEALQRGIPPTVRKGILKVPQ
jgi:hypothetical protein